MKCTDACSKQNSDNFQSNTEIQFNGDEHEDGEVHDEESSDEDSDCDYESEEEIDEDDDDVFI